MAHAYTCTANALVVVAVKFCRLAGYSFQYF